MRHVQGCTQLDPWCFLKVTNCPVAFLIDCTIPSEVKQVIKAIRCATNPYSTPQRGKNGNPKPNLKGESNSVVKRRFMLRICGIYQNWTCIKFTAFLDRSAIYLHHMKWDKWPISPSCWYFFFVPFVERTCTCTINFINSLIMITYSFSARHLQPLSCVLVISGLVYYIVEQRSDKCEKHENVKKWGIKNNKNIQE